MSEILKIAPNGQWTLEKNWKTPQIKAVDKWANDGQRSDLKKLPAATGDLRTKMINHLDKESESRINPVTMEKEYKAYRAGNINDNSHEKQLTSWTSDPSFAHYWTSFGHDEEPKVMHAWIPEKHIHSYLPYIQEKYGHEKNEGEMLVHPHDINIERTLSGKALNKENLKYGIKPKENKYHYDNGIMQLTKEQSKAMHGKDHPEHPGRVWNHSDKKSEVGYREKPGYSYDIEGDDFVGRKGKKEVHRSKL